MREPSRTVVLAVGIVGCVVCSHATIGQSEEQTLEDSIWEGARAITLATDQSKLLCPKVLRVWAEVLEAEGHPAQRASIEGVAAALNGIPMETSNSGTTPIPLPVTSVPPLDDARLQCPRYLLVIGGHFRNEYVLKDALKDVDVPYTRERRLADCIEVTKGARRIGAAILEEAKRGRIEWEGGPSTDQGVAKRLADYAQAIMNAADAQIGFCTTGDAELVYGGQREEIMKTLKDLMDYLASQQT